MAFQPENQNTPVQVQPADAGDQQATADTAGPLQADEISRRAMRLRDSEEEIGRLILRVREVTDTAVKEANDEAKRILDQAKAVLDHAKAEAAQIIGAAEIE